MLKELNDLSGLPTKLSETNIKREDFEAIAEKSINDCAMIVNQKQVSYNTVIYIFIYVF